MLAQAGVLGGRTVTSWPSLKTDLTNAGGNWVVREISTDRGLVTSRKPDYIPRSTRKWWRNSPKVRTKAITPKVLHVVTGLHPAESGASRSPSAPGSAGTAKGLSRDANA